MQQPTDPFAPDKALEESASDPILNYMTPAQIEEAPLEFYLVLHERLKAGEDPYLVAFASSIRTEDMRQALVDRGFDETAKLCEIRMKQDNAGCGSSATGKASS